MTVANVAARSLSEADRRNQLRRALIASTVGSTIEWYDFLLYGQMAALVFAKLYFPASDPLTGVLAAFAVFAVGFVARPVGAVVFGHYGDRIGRKSTLIATLLLTGLSTFLVGCVPTYQQIGAWAPITLVVLRLVQGIGLGGEWGGSVLLSMEWARTGKNRGFVASWPQLGAPAGFFAATLAILLVSRMSGDAFLTWGWRVPLWLSLGMVWIGLWARLGILETPVFRQVIEGGRLARVPLVEILKYQPREIILTALVQPAQTVGAFVYSAFFLFYGTKVIGASRDFLLVVMLIGSFLLFFTIPLSGHLCDRLGRRQIYSFGAGATGLFAFAYFALLDTRLPVLIALATVIAYFLNSLMWGPVAALTGECFAPRLRYTGVSVGYQFATALFGGTAPIIATALLARAGSAQGIAFYIFGCAIVSVTAAAALPDMRHRDFAPD